MNVWIRNGALDVRFETVPSLVSGRGASVFDPSAHTSRVCDCKAVPDTHD